MISTWRRPHLRPGRAPRPRSYVTMAWDWENPEEIWLKNDVSYGFFIGFMGKIHMKYHEIMVSMMFNWDLLSGKRVSLRGYGKSPWFIGKKNVDEPFSIAM